MVRMLLVGYLGIGSERRPDDATRRLMEQLDVGMRSGWEKSWHDAEDIRQDFGVE